MASLVEIKGNYYLQFYNGNKSPSQKKVSLGTKRKRVAQKLKRKYEDAYAQVTLPNSSDGRSSGTSRAGRGDLSRISRRRVFMWKRERRRPRSTIGEIG